MSRTRNFLTVLTILLVLTVGEFAFLSIRYTPSQSDINVRQSFTSLVGLPDLSLYSNSVSERHRTLIDVGSIYSVDPFAVDARLSSMIYKTVDNK